MKVLFPINIFYPAQGGPSNVVYWIAKALVKKGVAVTIVTTNSEVEGKVPADQWLETDYGRVIYYTCLSVLLPWRMMFSSLAAIPHCDVLHLTSLYYPSSLISAVVARWYGKFIIWSAHGELDELALIYSTWKKKPVLWLIRHFLSKNVTFHSTCENETQRIKLLIGQQVRVIEIPNFLELPALVNATQPNQRYLLYIGRIHPKKAIENLINALPGSLQFTALKLKLFIAGDADNPYADKLKEQINNLNLQDKVQFLGSIEGDAKEELYANAYFLILPSHTENFGNVVVESLAQGTPVIASTGTPWAILEEKQAGFWVENNPAALTAALEKALHLSTEDYQQYRDRAMNLAHQSFDIHENVGEWIAAYQTVIANYKQH